MKGKVTWMGQRTRTETGTLRPPPWEHGAVRMPLHLYHVYHAYEFRHQGKRLQNRPLRGFTISAIRNHVKNRPHKFAKVGIQHPDHVEREMLEPAARRLAACKKEWLWNWDRNEEAYRCEDEDKLPKRGKYAQNPIPVDPAANTPM